MAGQADALLLFGHGGKHGGCAVFVAAGGKFCIDRRAGAQESTAVESRSIEIFLLLDDLDVHFAKEGADRLLHAAPLARCPAVLYGHLHAAVVGEGEVRILINQLPHVGECGGRRTLFDNGGAVVADDDRLIGIGQLRAAGLAAADRKSTRLNSSHW